MPYKKCCSIQEFRNIIRYFLADINFEQAFTWKVITFGLASVKVNVYNKTKLLQQVRSKLAPNQSLHLKKIMLLQARQHITTCYLLPFLPMTLSFKTTVVFLNSIKLVSKCFISSLTLV